MALFVSGWPPPKPTSALFWEWRMLADNSSVLLPRYERFWQPESWAICIRACDGLPCTVFPVESISYLFFLACLRSFYPVNESILKETVLSWCDAFQMQRPCLVCFLCIWCNEWFMTAVLIMLHILCITIQFQALKNDLPEITLALFLSCFLHSK